MNEVKNILVAKLAAILGEIQTLPKSGHNDYHNYDYVTESDLVNAVRTRLAERGIFVFTSVENQTVTIVEEAGDKSALTTVKTIHTFVDSESGESFTVSGAGQGADKGDKGGYKAITGAMKYFIYKCFMIPTQDDPENDTPPGGYRRGTEVRTDRPITRNDVQDRSAAPATTTAARPAAAKPDLPVSTQAGEGWKAVLIHFGKNKGTTLGTLPEKTVIWYADNWQPKPFGTRGISGEDSMLRAALDQFRDWRKAKRTTPTNQPSPEQERRESNQDGADKDVPF